MNPFAAYKNYRRRRLLQRHALDDALWQTAVSGSRLLHGLTAPELTRLRQWVTLFLHAKQLSTAGGLVLNDHMRLSIALQACLPILHLDLDYYDGWQEIIIYPDEFVPEFNYMDEDGVVHHVHAPMSGEAWLGGPVILSWQDADNAHEVPGYNVVIHEFAHKLDMLNGDANGFPPLHADMNRQTWSSVFSAAFADFQRRVDTGEETELDPYAAENPGEFFAVISEVFFETPLVLLREYHEIYAQLRLFYRQDPAQRQQY